MLMPYAADSCAGMSFQGTCCLMYCMLRLVRKKMEMLAVLYMHTGAHASLVCGYVQVSELAIRHVKHLIAVMQMSIQLLHPYKCAFYLRFLRVHQTLLSL